MFYIKCYELDKTCIDICMLMGNSVDIYELSIGQGFGTKTIQRSVQTKSIEYRHEVWTVF